MRVDGNRRSDVSNRRHGKWNQSCTDAGPMTSTIQKQSENLFHTSARHVAGKAGRMRTLHKALRQRPSFLEAVLKASRLLVVSIVVTWAAPAFAQTSLQPTLEQLRPEYPTPMSPAQLAELLDRVAWLHRSEGWGLLRKDTGNRCPLSNGVPVSCDFLFHLPSRQGFDVLIRSDTDAVPAWQGPVDLSTEVSRFIFPIPPPGGENGPEPASVGDLDGDGRADLVWRNTSTGAVNGILGNGQAGTIAAGIPLSWQIIDLGDVNGDHRADLVWWNTQTGEVSVWLMNGATVLQTAIVASGVPLTWQIVGVGDLDGDGKADLVWRNSQTGNVAVWLMDGVIVRQAPVISAGVPLDWLIAGVADVDGDGKSDVVWRNRQTGDVAVWLMNGLTVRLSAVISSGVPLAWQLSGLGDLNHDGKADLVWRHAQSGNVAVWLLNGTAVTSALGASTGVPLSWQIVGVGDVDADGNSDLVWFEAQTVSLSVWLMNGGSVRQAIPVIVNGQPVL
ncbi:MAG: hypothetical protein DMF89_01380 [Acidobacteria bacterium]|nr:MAG: hypothetical protein DMF89_01380 [Acidobacteriota bacterium]